MPFLLDVCYLVLALLYLPILLFQMIVRGKNRRGWRERMGWTRPRPGTRPCIWIHGVSLGEINATSSLIAELMKRLPGYEIAISATTQTGYDEAVKKYAPLFVFRYPLDFSRVVRRVLDRIRPDAIVLMELEVWPNLLDEARRRSIPVGIANGRVTEKKSMRRFRWPLVRSVARRMFGQLAWVGAQDETFAARFRELGVPVGFVKITGTLKYDTALIADRVEGDDRLARYMEIDSGRPLWVAGSTGPEEEAIVLDAYAELRGRRPDLQLAVIPRKPERFGEVAGLIASRGFRCIRRTERPDLQGQDARVAEQERRRQKVSRQPAIQQTSAADKVVHLGDTMGELRKFYSLATVVFVGRTLVRLGGSDMMEVAGLGRPMIVGPHTDNFADVASKLEASSGVVRIGGPGELADAVERLLADPGMARRIGEAGREVVRRNVGATRLTADLLCESLGRRADHPVSSIATMQIQE